MISGYSHGQQLRKFVPTKDIHRERFQSAHGTSLGHQSLRTPEGPITNPGMLKHGLSLICVKYYNHTIFV